MPPSTRTVTLAILPARSVFAVIVAVPSACAVTMPAPLTDATRALELLQWIVAFASAGDSVAPIDSVLFICRSTIFCLFSAMAVGSFGLVTFTLTVAFFPPLTVVAVMVTVPAFLPVTTPSCETEAIFEDEDVHLIPDTAVAGFRVALSASFSCVYSPAVPVLFRLTAVGFVGSTTFTLTVVFFLFAVVAVMVTVPSFLGFTTPYASMVAIFVEDDFQVTTERAVTGFSVAVKDSVLPRSSDTVPVLSKLIPVGL